MNIRPFTASDAHYVAIIELNYHLEPEHHFNAAGLRAEE